jgi:non-reducing end alpha-L-arabinofuranosidase
MRTRSFWNEVSLVALLGVSCLGCKITSEATDAGVSSTGGSGGATSGSGGSTGTGGAGTRACTGTPTSTSGMTGGPCDIYAANGGPCIAAHSTVRALYAAYDGPLYQVRKTADGTTMDIGVLTAGGFANAADQDTFCGTAACTISIIYDQTGNGNNLTKAPAGGAKMTPDNEANAKSAPATFGGHAVYGVHVVPGVGYRNNTACGTATGDNAETEYMIVAGTPYNSGCCFDYGNMETTSRDDGEGTMEAVYFGNCTTWGKGADNGPWVMGDLENGLWAGNVSPYNQNVPVTYAYVTAMVKGDAAGKNHWTIKTGDAQNGMLSNPPTFDGQRPSSRYNPMRKEGAIGLGTGGDNTDVATGNWFEGVMTATYSPDSADDAVQANIVSVYGQ